MLFCGQQGSGSDDPETPPHNYQSHEDYTELDPGGHC